MSKFPVYRIGSTFWETFGADGFNEYGYNEQGYDRKGTRHIVLAGRAPDWFAQDDSFDAIVGTRNDFWNQGNVSGDFVTDFFFVPRDEEKPWVRGDCLIDYICYSQAAASGIRAADWPLGVNYMLIAGLDQNEADADDLRFLSEYSALGYR